MDSIIFDLDGTLWDSRMSICNIWKDILSKHDIGKSEITLEEMKNSMGHQLDEIAEMYFPYLDVETRLSLMNECCDIQTIYLAEHGGILYNDLEDTLKELSKEYKLFIVSNCQDGYIEAFLTYHKLKKYFSDYECPGRTGLSKGENNKLIIQRNNLKCPVYVGDTQGDADSAKFANIPFIFAQYGFGHVHEYDYVIHEFKDLINLCKKNRLSSF